MVENSRRRGKSVYERIEDTKNKIATKEQEVCELKIQLKTLEEERENLEMHQLFELIKNNGISFEQAKSILIKPKK